MSKGMDVIIYCQYGHDEFFNTFRKIITFRNMHNVIM